MKYSPLLIFLFFVSELFAQAPLNDNCINAFNIPSVDDYCSGDLEFSNTNATPDAGLPFVGQAQGCFQQHLTGVWFSFVPREPAVAISIFGDPGPGNIARTNMSIYEGSCSAGLNLVGCSTGSGASDELVLTGLTIGQRYYLLIESETSDIDFTLCINDFVAPRAPESDCPDAVVLCSEEDGFTIEELLGEGNISDELTGSCIDVGAGQNQEKASAWYVWTCDESGTLEFTITPGNTANANEDIDFIVYELPGGLDDCDNRISLRCMLSGETLNNTAEQNAPCLGPTGLRAGETDLEETAGCSAGDNNFVAPLDMVSGVSYGVLINNFSSTGFGFSLEFGGTGTFLGPEPDFDLFALEAFECDKRIEISNASMTQTDSIINYAWNFGVGADPQNASGSQTHGVVYESFGPKSIALTIESSRGCIVTKILDIDIEPCCEDFPDIQITGTETDLSCNDSGDGTIIVEGSLGTPEYSFSINGSEFSPSNNFNGLDAGTYEVTIIDIKGCESTQTFIVEEPEAIITDAGTDFEVDLGVDGELTAIYSPMNPGDVIEWSPAEGLSCTDCPNPTVTAPGTTTYTFTVTDVNGCTSQDFVTVSTNIIRPIFRPNVITPKTQDVNSSLVLGFGPQVRMIEEFVIYDRWGNLIFSCLEDREPNDPDAGWDGRIGTCNGEYKGDVQSGVYVWMAKVRYIDDVLVTYVDDVTVLR